MRLNITLAVEDLDVTAQFYRDILSLRLDGVNDSHGVPRYLLMTLDNLKIVFQQSREMEASHPALLQNLSRDSRGVGVLLEFDIPDLDVVSRRINHARWPIAYELDDREHRRRELWLHDPDGYLLVLNEEAE